MKKVFASFLVLLAVVTGVYSDEYVISKIECIDADYFTNREVTLKYDDEENMFYLCRYEYNKAYWFDLTVSQLNSLRATVKKAQEWSKQAKENKSTIRKEIPNSQLSCPVTMKWGNDWYTGTRSTSFQFMFVSSFEGETGITSILWSGSSPSSRQNSYIDLEFDSVILLNTEIDDFAEAISEKTVNTAINKHNQEKKAADLFN